MVSFCSFQLDLVIASEFIINYPMLYLATVFVLVLSELPVVWIYYNSAKGDMKGKG